MKTSDIRFIADSLKVFGWSYKDAKNAIEDYFNYDDLLEKSKKEEFLLICIHSKNKTQRTNKSFRYLLENRNYDDIDTINSIFKSRPASPFFLVLSLFEAISILNRKKYHKFKFTNTYSEFEGKGVKSLYPMIALLDKRGNEIFNLSEYARDTSYAFLDFFVDNIFSEMWRKISKEYEAEYMNAEQLKKMLIEEGITLNESVYSEGLEFCLPFEAGDKLIGEKTKFINSLILKVNLLVFNIKPIREFIDYLELQNNTNQIITKALSSIRNHLSSPVYKEDRKERTKKKYILIYCLVKELQNLGSGVRKSFREAGQLLGIKPSVIQPRYYEQLKRLEREGKKNHKELIQEYELEDQISNMLSLY